MARYGDYHNGTSNDRALQAETRLATRAERLAAQKRIEQQGHARHCRALLPLYLGTRATGQLFPDWLAEQEAAEGDLYASQRQFGDTFVSWYVRATSSCRAQAEREEAGKRWKQQEHARNCRALLPLYARARATFETFPDWLAREAVGQRTVFLTYRHQGQTFADWFAGSAQALAAVAELAEHSS